MTIKCVHLMVKNLRLHVGKLTYKIVIISSFFLVFEFCLQIELKILVLYKGSECIVVANKEFIVSGRYYSGTSKLFLAMSASFLKPCEGNYIFYNTKIFYLNDFLSNRSQLWGLFYHQYIQRVYLSN